MLLFTALSSLFALYQCVTAEECPRVSDSLNLVDWESFTTVSSITNKNLQEAADIFSSLSIHQQEGAIYQFSMLDEAKLAKFPTILAETNPDVLRVTNAFLEGTNSSVDTSNVLHRRSLAARIYSVTKPLLPKIIVTVFIEFSYYIGGSIQNASYDCLCYQYYENEKCRGCIYEPGLYGPVLYVGSVFDV
jgi:hypothetical protein